MADVVKSVRMVHVWEIMQKVGRATPAEILQQVATRLGVTHDDQNLKRNIYRDLKDMAEQGQIYATYTSPDGRELSPDEQDSVKNVRVEYSLRPSSAEERVPGWKRLADNGFELITPASRNLRWRAREFAGVESLKGQFSILFRGLSGGILVLQMPSEERPVDLVLARSPDFDGESSELAESLTSHLSQRATALLTGDASMSRPVVPKRLGHALIHLSAGGEVLARDLGSSTGSFYAPIERARLEELLQKGRGETTLGAALDPFAADFGFTPLSTQNLKSTDCFALKLGGFRMVGVYG